MCFFKKKDADKVKGDRELIADNAKAMEVLIALAESNPDAVKTLKEIQEQIKYLLPVTDPKVLDRDKVIKNKIDDLKIVLSKSGGETSKRLDEAIADLKVAIAERKSKV